MHALVFRFERKIHFQTFFREMESANSVPHPGPSAAAQPPTFKNVQFWIFDLLKCFEQENSDSNDWISTVGEPRSRSYDRELQRRRCKNLQRHVRFENKYNLYKLKKRSALVQR
jgi:hypothetical protein